VLWFRTEGNNSRSRVFLLDHFGESSVTIPFLSPNNAWSFFAFILVEYAWLQNAIEKLRDATKKLLLLSATVFLTETAD
jgi:hypothetical protein